MRTAIARRVVSALVGVLLCGAAAGAQGPGFSQHQPPFERAFGNHGFNAHWWNSPRMIEALKLTDDQRKAMDQILFQHREKLIDLQSNLEKAELAMEPLMSADQPAQAAMEAQIDKVVAARAALERANARFLLDIRMKLTSDQWKQLKDLRHERVMNQRAPGQHRMWRQGPAGPDGQGAPPPAAAPGASPAAPPAQGPGPDSQQ